MTITFSGNTPDGIVRSVTNLVTRISKVPELAGEEAAELGADFMRNRITQMDRILTGDMLGDVDVIVNSRASRWGWIDLVQDYYAYQNNGTQHVSAMNAVRDSREAVREALPGIVQKWVGNGFN